MAYTWSALCTCWNEKSQHDKAAGFFCQADTKTVYPTGPARFLSITMQEPVGLGSTSPSLQSASEKRHSRLESKSLSLENKFKSKATFKQGVPRNIAGFLLSILVVFVLATYVILIGASHLFGANAIDVMDLDEVLRRAGIPESAGIGSTNATLQHLGASAPYIPRIVHQTWKVDQVPDQWQPVRQHCMDLLPDFEFRMWSDIESRRFIQDHYPFFVKTWDSYRK